MSAKRSELNPHGNPLGICQHVAAAPGDGYITWFSGSGKEFYWVCPVCSNQFPDLPEGLLTSTNEILENCQTEAAACNGIVGSPEVKQRSSSIHFEHYDYPQSFDGKTIDIQPHPKSPDDWFVLFDSGDLAIINPSQNRMRALFQLTNLGFDLDDETELRIAPKHDFAAVFGASKQQGCVFDLQTGAVSARIDRGNYRPENSRFPVAFFEYQSQSLLIVATAWNRLDIIDPATGRLLTKRETTSSTQDSGHHEHHLDYFHAELVVSPGGNWIADNGWVWSPRGVVRSWNLVDWLEQNPWESEDGPSLKELADRAYYWDGPLCWVDNSTIAIWGWGHDDEWLIPAIRLFDVKTGQEVNWFPGPLTRSPRAWPPKKLAPSLFYDNYLFSVHDDHGTSVWDVSTGECLHTEPSLVPIHFHPVSKTFLSVTPAGIRLSRMSSKGIQLRSHLA